MIPPKKMTIHTNFFRQPPSGCRTLDAPEAVDFRGKVIRAERVVKNSIAIEINQSASAPLTAIQAWSMAIARRGAIELEYARPFFAPIDVTAAPGRWPGKVKKVEA